MNTDNVVVLTSDPLFPLGELGMTHGAINLLAELGRSPQELIQRHASCDWSDMSPSDAAANRHALRSGMRIFSSFDLPGGCRVWVITEADRSSTTLMLPAEY